MTLPAQLCTQCCACKQWGPRNLHPATGRCSDCEAKAQAEKKPTTTFRAALDILLMHHDQGSPSDTPSHVLRNYVCRTLDAFDIAVHERSKHHAETHYPRPKYPRHGEDGVSGANNR